MNKINARSPYIFYDNSTNSGSALSDATLKIWIYTGYSVSGISSAPTYAFTSTAINGEVSFDVSDIVRDYINNTFDGNYDSGIVWVNWGFNRTYENDSTSNTTQYTLAAFDGYGYFEDGTNPQNYSIALQSNDLIYTNDLSNVNVPVHVDEEVTVVYLKDNEIVSTKVFASTTNSAEQIQYASSTLLDYDVFYNRILDDGAEIEAVSCVKEFATDYHSDIDVDTIYVSKNGVTEVIKVQEIEECKHNPYKITFVNKFGALQDVWFFKRSNLSLKTTKDSYRANILTGGSYSTNERQERIFNKTGKEYLKLNTGFYPESYNEIFRQLSLSEELWISYENRILPVNLVSSDLNYKTSRNDKLINYTIDIEFANEKINNIR